MRPKIGITMGDPAGIGPEIVIRALGRPEIYELCQPVVYGDRAALNDAVEMVSSVQKIRVIPSVSETQGHYGTVELINADLLRENGWQYGVVSGVCGAAAFQYIHNAIEDALAGRIAAVVTGPINKEALHRGGYQYAGHTEIFAELTGAHEYAMVLTTDRLRVIHVTTHVSMRNACDLIQKDRVLSVIRLADEAMKMQGIEHPRIAVAGLNPHASEHGLFGAEEEREISPAIAEAKTLGIRADGPIPPDTVFVRAIAGEFDIVVAMYHDQGHIPLKLMGFQLDAKTNRYTAVSGVNMTVGLPIIRTSVDHGTAFDRAGKGQANEESLVDAIRLAVQMARYRAK